MGIKSYSELMSIKSFQDRLEYLKLYGRVGDITFGGNRYLNQMLYHCYEWEKVKRDIVIRDKGNDLAHEDYPILSKSVYVHHINPITPDDILNRRGCVFDPENLISSSFQTHNAIHYGNDTKLSTGYAERKPNDTCPWR